MMGPEMVTLTTSERRQALPAGHHTGSAAMETEPMREPTATDAAAAAFVRFVNVQKTYDGNSLVVKGLNLDVRKGEFLTMLGPSGSGKTSCLMMLAGFEPVTRGDIRLGGKSLNNVSPQRRGIGMVFQNYALFPHMTVGENLAFPLEVRRQSRLHIQERVRKALSMVRLEGFESRRPAQLSGGQQQRVAVARALVFEPEIILMDEPLGALDKKLRQEMQLEIKHIHERLGVTVFYVTHDQSEALTMSDHIAVLHEGELQQVAPPVEIYETPRNLFVANFIGENNTLTGKILHADETRCRILLDDNSEVVAVPVGLALDSRAVVAIRPERVRLLSTPSALPNAGRGRIEEVVYFGDHIRVRLAIFGRSDFVVKLTEPPASGGLERGAYLDVGWAIEHARAFRDGASVPDDVTRQQV
jgi:putative spermidine/putrescine transport system ATP-binding protein